MNTRKQDAHFSEPEFLRDKDVMQHPGYAIHVLTELLIQYFRLLVLLKRSPRTGDKEVPYNPEHERFVDRFIGIPGLKKLMNYVRIGRQLGIQKWEAESLADAENLMTSLMIKPGANEVFGDHSELGDPDMFGGKTHIFTWCRHVYDDDDAQTRRARFIMLQYCMPAAETIYYKEILEAMPLYARYEGEIYRVVGNSQMGDVWLAPRFSEAGAGYTKRVYVDDLTNWSDKP